MPDTDWNVWPLFLVELFTFLLLFLPIKARFLGLTIQTWMIVLLLGVDVGIVISLAHDSTETLNLYF